MSTVVRTCVDIDVVILRQHIYSLVRGTRPGTLASEPPQQRVDRTEDKDGVIYPDPLGRLVPGGAAIPRRPEVPAAR